LLKMCGLLKHILPEVDAMQGVQQPAEFHPEGDVWLHTLMLLGQLENASLTLALGALLHDVGKPPTFQIADRIRFNQHEKVGVAELARETPETLRPRPLVTGRDLIALGFKPGPIFATILTDVEDRQLEGTLTDSAAAIDYVKKTYA